MNVIRGKLPTIFRKETIKIDEIVQQISFKLSNGKKSILVISLYRILQATDQGIFTSISQYNQIQGEINTATKYRKQILQNMVQLVEQEVCNNIIIYGDFNQDIASSKI